MTGPNGKKFPFHNHGGKEMPKGTQQKNIETIRDKIKPGA